MTTPTWFPVATTTPTSTNNKAPIELNGPTRWAGCRSTSADTTPPTPVPTVVRTPERAPEPGPQPVVRLAGLAALWPAPTAESHADLEFHATGSNDVPSHADLFALDRASSRIVHLPAPDPVPPDPATFNPATRSAVHSSVHSAVPRAMRGTAGPSAAESGRRGRSPT